MFPLTIYATSFILLPPLAKGQFTKCLHINDLLQMKLCNDFIHRQKFTNINDLHSDLMHHFSLINAKSRSY